MLVRYVFVLFLGLMFETMQGLFNIAWHRKIDFALVIVPVKQYTDILTSFTVFVEIIMLSKYLDEMTDILGKYINFELMFYCCLRQKNSW